MLTKKAPRPETAPSMSIGRKGAICEYEKTMQIPPRFERRCAAYKCVEGDLQYAARSPEAGEK